VDVASAPAVRVMKQDRASVTRQGIMVSIQYTAGPE
jgi:hypothetical protein